MDIDQAHRTFEELCENVSENAASVQNEAEARFHLIDRVLQDVLGWDNFDTNPEVATGTGYIDYLLKANDQNQFVIEAKRADGALLDTSQPDYRNYSLSGPALRSAKEGIEQAQRYCLHAGVGFAAVTNGYTWIAFQAVRTDGQSPNRGKALVFPNLQSISRHFAEFFDVFSKVGITEKRISSLLLEAEGLNVAGRQPEHKPIPDNDVYLLKKTDLGSDLQALFDEFFSSMSGDDDPEMLSHCFVETKESAKAQSEIAKITASLVSNIKSLSSEAGELLYKELEHAITAARGEMVLIIGNKGAGKSTFMDRFFRQVLPRNLRKECLVLRINLGDFPGQTDGLQDQITDALIEEIRNVMFHKDAPTFDELLGIFFREYQQWSTGEFKPLYESDKDTFHRKFGEYMFQFRQNQPYDYLIHLLIHAVRARKLMPCIVFDNADHFSKEFQDAVFQFAQSIRSKVLSVTLVPITDRTFWQLSKSGPMQSYSSKTFYLPVPPTGKILEKRVEYIKLQLNNEDGHARQQYFLSRGIRLTFDNISGFVESIENMFIRTEYISRRISWLANFDIRRMLEIARRIVASSNIQIDDLVKTYIRERRVFVKQDKILRGLLLGDYNYFYPEDNAFIINIFDTNGIDTSPLTKLSILRFLMDVDDSGSNPLESYVTLECIVQFFEPMGFNPYVLRNLMTELMEYRLIEPYDPTEERIQDGLSYAVTSSGRIHYEMALNDHIYMSQLTLRHGYTSEEVAISIRDKLRSGRLSREDWTNIIGELVNYCLLKDRRFVSRSYRPEYRGQCDLREALANRWMKSDT